MQSGPKPHTKPVWSRSRLSLLCGLLCGTAAPGGDIADGAVDQRTVQRIQMREQGGNLGQERVRKNGGDLFVAAAARVPDKLAYVHLESCGEPLKRTQCGDRFAVFNFR